MTGEEALLSLLKGFKPLRCEGCEDPEIEKRAMVEPILGDIKMHDGSIVPAAVYRHGAVWDHDARKEKPHWERKVPIRTRPA